MAKVQIPYIKLLPKSMGGEQDAELYSLAQFASTVGSNSRTEGDTTHFEVANDKMSLGIAKLIVSKGGDVSGFPVWIIISKKTDKVPEGIPGRVRVDDEGKEVIKTWEEWIPTGHSIIEGSDKKLYVGATDGKINFSISQLIPVIKNLVDTEGYKSILPVAKDDI